jgi:hypothetical protein
MALGPDRPPREYLKRAIGAIFMTVAIVIPDRSTPSGRKVKASRPRHGTIRASSTS